MNPLTQTNPDKNFSTFISVNTEMPDKTAGKGFRGWVFYDANCAFCVSLLARCDDVFRKRGYVFIPLQEAIKRGGFEIEPAEFHREMKLLRADGEWLGGADAWIQMFNSVWYLHPFGLLAALPGLHALAHAAYRYLAANRRCLNGVCTIPSKNRPSILTGVIPLIAFPLITLAFKAYVAPWVFMWALALSIFVGCKWLTFADARRRGVKYDSRTAFAYLFVWTGMNSTQFPAVVKTPPPLGEFVAAITKLLIGVSLLWLAIPALPTAAPLVVGWIGMIGVVLILHFGLFHLISVVLRRNGFNAPAMMQAPLLARSVAEFWGLRWNQPFHELTTRYFFRPLTVRMGGRAALFVCFVISGLIHDLVITFPAGGGYGLPTLYFAIQGLGLLAEKRLFRGGRFNFVHRCYAWVIIAGPVGLLFPPIFVENVILPMLTAFGTN